MRLIDVDKLTHDMCQYVRGEKSIGQIIDEQPTAYDVDKIIKELENLKTVKPMGSIASTKKVTSETIRVVDKIIDIIERGATNETN